MALSLWILLHTYLFRTAYSPEYVVLYSFRRDRGSYAICIYSLPTTSSLFRLPMGDTEGEGITILCLPNDGHTTNTQNSIPNERWAY